MSADEASFLEALTAAIGPWQLALTAAQLHQLFSHFEAVVETNRVMNLTRITEPVDAAVKHYADSLALAAWAGARGVGVASLLDVGTGAGFPAAPLAIARPDWRVVALDGTRKKAEFVARVAGELGLHNLSAEHAHSEHWESKQRFDVIAARALGTAETCIRSAGRFLRAGGRLVLYKTPNAAGTEQGEARSSVKELGLRLEEPFGYELHLKGEVMRRVLVVYRRSGRREASP